MNTQLNRKRIVIFVAFAFGIPGAAAVVLRLTVGMEDLVKAALLTNYIFMIWTPALANVATRLITKEGRGQLMLRPNFRRGWRFYVAAWLLPFLAVAVGGALYYLLFPQFFDPNNGEMQKFVSSVPPLAPWAETASSGELLLAVTLLITLTGVPQYAVLSSGEEFGWRAYLLPKLVAHLAGTQGGSNSAGELPQSDGFDAAAARKAALLVGVIWGVWHWPLHILFNPELDIFAELLFVVSTCWLSVLLSWVTLRSGSVWPAAIGHGTFNLALGLHTYLASSSANPLLGPAPSGLIGGIALAILALVLLFRSRPFVRGKEAGEEKEPAVVGAQRYEPLA